MATNYNYPVPNEGRMAKTYLAQLEQDARALRELLGDQDDMPGWVKFYVATSADRMNTASRYMQYEAARMKGTAKFVPYGADLTMHDIDPSFRAEGQEPTLLSAEGKKKLVMAVVIGAPLLMLGAAFYHGNLAMVTRSQGQG